MPHKIDHHLFVASVAPVYVAVRGRDPEGNTGYRPHHNACYLHATETITER